MKNSANSKLTEMGQRVRDLREQRCMNQRELARMSGVAHATISLVERGVADLRTMKLKLIADALQTSLDYLISGVPITTLAKVIETNPFLVQHIDKLLSIPYADQLKLEEILDLFILKQSLLNHESPNSSKLGSTENPKPSETPSENIEPPGSSDWVNTDMVYGPDDKEENENCPQHDSNRVDIASVLNSRDEEENK